MTAAIKLRPGESASWVAWANQRYQPATVKHRRGAHLAVPSGRATLCMRRPVLEPPAADAVLCRTCRQVSIAAYELHQEPTVPPDRHRGMP